MKAVSSNSLTSSPAKGPPYVMTATSTPWRFLWGGDPGGILSYVGDNKCSEYVFVLILVLLGLIALANVTLVAKMYCIDQALEATSGRSDRWMFGGAADNFDPKVSRQTDWSKLGMPRLKCYTLYPRL